MGLKFETSTCMLALQLKSRVKSEKQNIHDHKFTDAENPLAVPIVIPKACKVREGDKP
jgi:hypothetical protein